ncbi:MAG: tetratricopeptide repeat protein [Ferruginibacter sp.]
MLKIITLILLTTFSTLVFAQTNYEKFKKLFKNNDTTKIESLFAEWEKSNPNDPELYTSAINFYFSNSQQEIISLDGEQKSKQSFQLTDSTGKVAGYMNSNQGFNPGKLGKAIKYANTGIEKFPNRLDIRFGKCYVLQQIGDYDNFTKEVIKTIEYSHVNNNVWLWTENKKQEDGESFMLETIQSYLKQLYDTEDDNLLPNMIQIGESTLKYYDNNVEILSTTSVALMLTKNYDKAIEYLKRAEKINPKDFIVLNNIAQGYKLKGDKANAIKYYQLTEKYGDEQAKQQARQSIEALQK